jgi:predicted ester cyclase
MSNENKVLARRWFEEAWNEKRPDVVDQLVHLKCVGHHEGMTTNSRDEVKAFRDDLLKLIPDIHADVEEVIAEGDDAVVRWTLSGTSGGKAVRFHGITWLKFCDGQIIEGWDRWDRTGFVQALAS